MFQVNHNAAQFDAKLKRDLGNDLPFAVARAITWTLKDVQSNNPKWMRRAFDNPNAWTLNSMRVQPATKRMAGRVFFKNEVKAGGKGTNAGRYLQPNILGLYRPHTRWEKLLIAKGVLFKGEYAMPASGMKLNAFGNVPSRIYPEIIAQLKLGSNGIGNQTSATKARRKARGVARVFIPGADGRPSSLPRGIWQRERDSSISPLFIFTTNRPAYEVLFPWQGLAAKTVANRLPTNLQRSASAILRKSNRL
ncbi:MAG: hypothetical protein U5K75_09035 [Ahrensia sp.]|nr:hypothetical protein [Ahrensia sp.]